MCGCNIQNQYNAIATAVLDALRLAHAALHVMEQCLVPEDDSITRFFDTGTPHVLERVYNMFNALVGTDGLGAPELLDPGYQLETWLDHGSSDYVIFEHPRSCDNPYLMGYMNHFVTNDRKTWMMLCPRIWTTFPSSLGHIGCDDLHDVAGYEMVVPGAVLLHELMHWRMLSIAHANIEITDWNWRQYDVNPPNGYGP